MITEVSAALGNTPTVARASYIDPRVIDAFAEGATISRALSRAARADTEEDRRAITERAVIRLLRGASQ